MESRQIFPFLQHLCARARASLLVLKGELGSARGYYIGDDAKIGSAAPLKHQ